MKKIIYILFVINVIGTTTTSVLAFYDQEDFENQIEEEEYDEYVEVASDTSGSIPKINAPAAILYDRKYKKVLYNKNMNEKRPNASTTKIMTAIVAYENGNMYDVVTVSQKAANVGGSTIRLRKGDQISLNDLMHGLLICSGNDAAIAIAEHIGGSVEKFCELMNEKAKEIGAYNTNFLSPHGLDIDNHYSTAYDLAIMSDYSLNIKYIADIMNKRKAEIKINNYIRTIGSTNEILSLYNGANGVKTGYTGKAGRCLIASVTKDDWQIISVVLGCNTKKQRTNETIKLLNYGFNEFEFMDLCENMKKDFHISVNKSKKKEYNIKIEATYIQPVTDEELNNINYIYKINQNLEAPVTAGEKIGDVEIYVKEDLVKTLPIIIGTKIERKTLINYFFECIFNLGRYYRIN